MQNFDLDFKEDIIPEPKKYSPEDTLAKLSASNLNLEKIVSILLNMRKEEEITVEQVLDTLDIIVKKRLANNPREQ